MPESEEKTEWTVQEIFLALFLLIFILFVILGALLLPGIYIKLWEWVY